MQRHLKNAVVAVAIAVLGGATIFWWWPSRGGSKPSFTSVKVKRGDVAGTIGASGTIEPLEVVDVGAQVAGRVSAFGTDTDGKTIDYGSIVEKGSLLWIVEGRLSTEIGIGGPVEFWDRRQNISSCATGQSPTAIRSLKRMCAVPQQSAL